MVYTDLNSAHFILNPVTSRYEGDDVSVDSEIYLRVSDDSGSHWSNAVRVSPDTTGRSQFQPRIALDQTTGDIAIGFYDASDDPANVEVIYKVVVSRDGANSFLPPFRVAQARSNGPLAPVPAGGSLRQDFREYHGLDFHLGVLFPVWADNSNSTGDVPQSDWSATSHPMEMYGAKLRIR